MICKRKKPPEILLETDKYIELWR